MDVRDRSLVSNSNSVVSNESNQMKWWNVGDFAGSGVDSNNEAAAR